MESKKCNGCGITQPLSNFYIRKSGKRAGQLSTPCKNCRTTIRRLKYDFKSMTENKECPQYLGIVVAEKALSKFYKHIIRMPFGNRGYDYICDKGYKIDVKSACLSITKHRSPYWNLFIGKNKIADYFLILLFNNRKDLDPMYVLLVPSKLVNSKQCLSITNIQKCLLKWTKYMQPLDKVISCCNAMKEEKNE